MNDINELRIEDIVELTAMQQGMLFQKLYDGQDQADTYFEQVLLTLGGSLQVQAWQQAWQDIMDRHGALRSTFHWQDLEQPLQIIEREVALPWTMLDWRGQDAASTEQALATLLQADRAQGLELDLAPLMRMTLIQQADHRWHLLWSHHHILFDGWSMAIILDEVMRAYAARSQGRHPALPPAPAIRDYLQWLQTRDVDAARQAWREQLQGFDAPTPLPMARGAGTGLTRGSGHGVQVREEVRLSVDADTVQSLREFARSQRVTLNTIVQAAWALLLSRHAQCDDVSFGITVSGRPAELPGVAKMVGLLINTLPLRVKLDQSMPAGLWLQNLQKQTQQLEDIQFLPLAEIQATSDLAAGQALFGSLLVFENYPVSHDDQPGQLRIDDLRTWEQTSYPLTLIAVPEQSMSLRFSYAPQHFDRDLLQALLEQLATLLSAMRDAPQSPLADLPWLTARDQTLLLQFNATDTDYPRDASIAELFEAQAAARPQAIALQADGQSWTYAALNQQANRLAHDLAEHSALQGPTKPGSASRRVAVCFERSAELIASLLALMKLGAAYVPIDPEFPAERAHYMVADSGAALILTQPGLRERFADRAIPVLCIDPLTVHADQETGLTTAASFDNPPRVASALTPAYVGYTSGSTGQPKGVCIPHRGVVRLVSHTNYLDFGPQVSFLQIASLAFDASTLEIWGSLLSGGRLVVMPAGRYSLAQLADALQREQITTMWLTAGLFHAMVDEYPQALTGLKQLLTGGDVVSPVHVEKIRRLAPELQLINGYGPTENTTFTSCCDLNAVVGPASASLPAALPIGRPVANTRVYVLDNQDRPLPIGVVGELCAAGDGLALGYLGQDALNAQKFAERTLFGRAERIYRTGDLARWRLDGQLEFLGRRDTQIKLRGFRIELGEVEAALTDHPSVGACAVVVHGEGMHQRLIAHLVALPTEPNPTSTDPNLAVLGDSILSALGRTMPAFMVPTAVQWHAALPLNNSGKVDRKALAQLAMAGPVATDLQQLPRTPDEQLMAELWCQVLQLDSVGIAENFFALGGHSLLATQLISRIHEAFAHELPLRALFEQPTIAGLVQALERQRDNLHQRPPVVPQPRYERMPLSYAQERLWFLEQLSPGNPFYNSPQVLRLRGELDIDALGRALTALVVRHESLRTVFGSDGDRSYCQILPVPTQTLPITRVDGLGNTKVSIPTDGPHQGHEHAHSLRAQITAEAHRPFDLTQDLPIRACLFNLAPDDQILLLTVHHIAIDGWSYGVLMRELGALYEAERASTYSAGRALAPLAIQYADFALWQRQWLQGEVLAKQRSFWIEQLQDMPTVLDLPADRPRPPVHSFRGGEFVLSLPPELTAQLRQFARNQGATVFMVALAAFAAVVQRWTGQARFVLGTPIANRHHPSLEPLIGFFVNTLPLPMRLDGVATFSDLLEQVRHTTRDAYAHQDFPFEQMVEALRLERDLSRPPLAQVLITAQNAPSKPLSLQGLHVEPFAFEALSVRSDLEVSLWDDDDTLHCVAYYYRDIFDEATIRRLLDSFGLLLAAALQAPDAPLLQHNIVSADDRQQIAAWNATEQALPDGDNVVRWFERNAAAAPEALAMVHGNQTLSVDALNRQANQVAHALLALGLGADQRVAVCARRSADLVIAELGILKAGAAYVPLDPDHPADRMRLMIEDCGAPAVLCEAALVAQLPDLACTVLTLEQIAASDQSDQNPGVLIAPQQLAYTIYTSGSTGRPKGVMVEHRSLLNLIQWHLRVYGLSASDRCTMLANPAFDASTWEVWPALCAGASLHPVPADLLSDLEALSAHLAQTAVTVMFLPTPLLEQAMASDLRWPDTLRLILTGGDRLRRYPATTSGQYSGPRIANNYGPTENTVVTTWTDVVPAMEKLHLVPPIGRPLDNTRLYILDAELQPVPIGVPGELCIAGTSLARGYLNRPDLTDSSFIYLTLDGRRERLYRSGDLARWRADGRIEFMGRRDHQIKLRGYRIELGEIESVLGQHPQVAQCAVSCHAAMQGGDQRLVAYVVPMRSNDAAPEVQAQAREAFVAGWEELYNDSYSHEADDATFDIHGWNNSYTGEPIPAEQMRTWVDSTVDSICALQPQHLLEIGCGSGLLLTQIAPKVASYQACDLSPVVIARLQRLCASRADLRHVALAARRADDLHGIAARSVDTVVINSVIQYFPSADYLVQVLEHAIDMIGAGGHLFVGDVRHLGLLRAFHAATQAHRADAQVSCQALRQRVAQQELHDKELVIDPRLFVALALRHPRVTGLRIQLHRGNAYNELTQFRYHAIFEIDHPGQSVGAPALQWTSWPRDGGIGWLREKLETERPPLLAVRDVPNARLAGPRAVLDWLAHADAKAPVADVMARLQAQTADGIDPEALHTLADSCGYALDLSWQRGDTEGRFDLLLRRRDDPQAMLARMPIVELPVRTGQTYANDPLRGQLGQQLIPQLRDALAASLPEYMLPSAFMLVDALPLSPNGKVDRKALPDPELVANLHADKELVAPRTATEATIERIWADVLRVERVGVFDNFFSLGGHSLLATQVISRLRQAFKRELPVRVLFEAPTVALLAETLGAIGDEGPARPPLTPQPRPERLPLSFAQERLWFLARLVPDSPFYNAPLALHLHGAIDVAAMAAAVTALVQRHDTLRSLFADEAGTPYIRLTDLPPAGLPLQLHDVQGLEPTAARQRISDEALIPFDLSRDLPIRASLFQLAAHEYVLLLSLHHIATDGWSQGVMRRDLGALYQAAAQGVPTTLPALPIAYADYAIWQRSWLHGDALQRQLRFWRERLDGMPRFLALAADYPRPAVHTFRGATLERSFSPELTAALRRFGQQHGCTLFMTALSAFAVVMGRHSGQQQFVIGSPIANRHHQAVEDLVGFFVNTLALPIDLAGAPTFVDLLAQVRRTTLDAYAHQDLPFERLVEALDLERDLSHNPLVQVVFAVQNAPRSTLRLGDSIAQSFDFDVDTVRSDLEVHLWEDDEQIHCFVPYYRDLFEPQRIVRLIEHFEQVMLAITQQADQALAALAPLTADDARWLQSVNPIPQSGEAELTVIDRFERIVDQSPNAIAVRFDGQTLSYKDLDQLSNQIAHTLIAKGAGPDTRVALCVPRSIAMVAALLGVLKSGAAYVPLDPDYPQQRLSLMLENAAPTLMLAHSAALQRLPAWAETEERATLLRVDQLQDWLSDNSQRPARRAGPDDLAYVLYTSGSTGTPKGVMLPHRALSNLIGWQARQPGLDRPETTLQFTSLSFDVSFQEIFSTWTQGGTLVLIDDQLRRDPAALLDYLAEHQIERLYLPFIALHHLAEEVVARPRSLALHHLITAGEQLQMTPALRQWLAQSGIRLHNHYGPTESHVVTAHSLPALSPDLEAKGAITTSADWAALPPIGAPIANTRIYLLDAQLQPVPPGVAGELCIAGDCLARGYLNQPELTAERFVTVTVLGRNERVYRTGDQARWLPQGELEYLGRLDQQVKIRGFRVELGEIEAQLAAHPDVAATTVVVREPSPGVKTLAAYLVMRQPVASAELRGWLKQRLPEYMVPASLTVLDAMPLTPSGKVDRRALPDPTDEAGQGRALNGASEELLASIWADILGVGALTASSHFFDLGGHSLLATRVVSQIRERFDIACPLRVLFERPVLADLAAWLDQQQRGTDEPRITPLPEGSLLRPSPAQEGLWFLAQLEGGSASYNMPAALRLHGALDEAALRHSLMALTERQASLRQSFRPLDGQLVLQERAAWDPVTLIDLSAMPDEQREQQVRTWAHQHALAPFDLSAGPLLRVSLLRLATDHHVLLLNLHHSINDGWSYGVLVREWAELYRAAREQRPAQLPALPIAYRDVAAWQHQWLTSAAAQDQLRWWVAHLQGAPALLDLPTDFPRPPQQSYRGDRMIRTLSPELSQAVKNLSRQQGVTLFMTLISALQVLLHRHSGQDDLCIGTPVANRGLRQTEHLVGLFINTLALRARIEPQATFADLLTQTRQTALAAFARQDMPFERVVQALSPERSLAHAPVFQALFVMQNNASAEFAFADLQIASVDQDTPIAKYDLTLSAEEGPDGVLCHWEFATDLFTAARIERMAAQFEQILSVVTAAPQTPIAQIALLTPDDRTQLRAFGHGGSLPSHRPDLTVVDLFDAQTGRTPDADAISFGDQILSYVGLAARANQVAQVLVQHGVRADTLVGLCMPRSLELVVGMLGIVKSGAAYVPLDPDYPPQRLAMMLHDAAAPIVLTHSSVRDRLPELVGVTVLCLDDPAPWQHMPQRPPEVQITSAQLAYVIYTSGSTGVPKGVAIEHGSLAASTLAREQVFRNTGQTLQRVMLVPSFAFDAFGAGLWHALAVGMTVDLPAAITDLAAVRERIALRRIDALFGPPVWYRALISLDGLEPLAIDAGKPIALQTLRQVVMGGEAPSPTLLLEHAAQMPETRLFSEYGPTEATVWCTITEYTNPQQNVHAIGKPIPGIDLILLDDQGRSVPVGVPGELHIAGQFLARGYLNRPDQTEAQFIHADIDGQHRRLYRTGDLARWLPDGQLEFLGRRDHQIKLRGLRIELGEIEAALLDQPAIAECAVVCAGVRGSDQRLVGHLVLAQGHTDLPLGPLRDALKARLPEHMVPSLFVMHPQLPITPNGKLDRVALAAIDISSSAQDADIAPRSLLELQLLRIWQDVLKTDAIGLHDSFFDAGGNSLRVASLASVIERRLGIKVPIGVLFRENSIARQAAYLQSQRGASKPSVLVPLQPHGDLTPLFCVHPGGGTVIWYRHLAYRFNPQRPLYGLDSQGIADDAKPMDTIEAMASAYVQAIRGVQPQGPYALAGWCFGGLVAVEMARQLRAAGQSVAMLIIFDALDPHPPFNEALLQDVGFFVELFKTDVAGLEDLHQQVADLDEPAQLQHLIDAARQAGEVSDDFGLEQARRQLAIFRGHMLAQRDYDLQHVPGRVVFLQAAEGMAAGRADPIFGWADRVDEAEVHWVPGDHTGMMVEPQVGALAQTLEMLMSRTFEAGGA